MRAGVEVGDADAELDLSLARAHAHVTADHEVEDRVTFPFRRLLGERLGEGFIDRGRQQGAVAAGEARAIVDEGGAVAR